ARTILLRDKRRAHCLTGSPATIGELRERFNRQNGLSGQEDDRNEFAGFVVRQASLVLDIEERGLRGRRYKVPRFVADSLRASPKFRSEMTRLAKDLNKPEQALYEEAGKYNQFLHIFARFFVKRLFSLVKTLIQPEQ